MRACAFCGRLLKGAAIACTCFALLTGGEAHEPVPKVYSVPMPRAFVMSTSSSSSASIVFSQYQSEGPKAE